MTIIVQISSLYLTNTLNLLHCKYLQHELLYVHENLLCVIVVSKCVMVWEVLTLKIQKLSGVNYVHTSYI
jgi:hypothetical protein